MDNDNRPFWRTPAMWLVLGLPLAAVVAGIALVVTSIRSGSSDAVIDDVQRVSQIQTTDLGPDELASQLKLSAVLRLLEDGGGVEVIPVSGDFPRQDSLVLVLQHPTEADQDLRLELTPSDTGWRADAEVSDRHDWILQLSPADGHWRLRGRVPKQLHAARLAPSLKP
ncbi:nitrogen fixation protein FixH [Pseudoxanthomonas kalamensis DSM 18571]|uniref:FixH family protein n=1 Tax=Pseudoxanthomonas kalamensis TaxID=289483 RepID=UPI001391175B|nr:FixH family protein [Pseudoxanthomonas kalamensis]KAF1709259.1 nitrogen fixation protein FixH [Pseudoxanthomonas kalamensis DSM 18571]